MYTQINWDHVRTVIYENNQPRQDKSIENEHLEHSEWSVKQKDIKNNPNIMNIILTSGNPEKEIVKEQRDDPDLSIIIKALTEKEADETTKKKYTLKDGILQ
jgi:hypothetical protein